LKFINIAGKKLSLDFIEHSLLRRSKNKYSLGYLNKIFTNKFERAHRVSKLDWRIHFALNCGAKSCPPIAFYNAARLNEQLNVATKNFLLSECIYTPSKNIIAVPAFMSWFRRDFKGKKGILAILKTNGIVKQNAKPAIKFKKYDWSLQVANYEKN
jgi:hypothetical protein